MQSQDVSAFLPVKVTDRQWAEALLDGSVYMRSLFEYGAWNNVAKASGNAEEMNNVFRGDIHEGTIRNVDPKAGDDFYNTLPPELRSLITNAWYIDVDLFPYLKVYCLYRLTYNISQKQFERPDERLKDFGDTAVIIHNPDEFLDRVLRRLYERYGDSFNFKMREVSYFDISRDYGDFDVFWKTTFYEWQKELRIAVGLLDGSKSIIDGNGRLLKPLIQDVSALTLDVGSIRDIAIPISTDDLINLMFPPIIGIPDYGSVS
jgi:hypothetical protein